jgi:hypothetical protein
LANANPKWHHLRGTTPAVDHLSENQKKQPETKPELNHHQPTKPPPSMGQNSAPSTALEHDVIVTCQKRPKKRKNGPLPVKPATFSDGCKVQPIKNGEWLTDEHVDNAQAILAQHFPYIRGLQAVWVFISEGCQYVGTPTNEFVQILNIAGNHWITVSNIGCPKHTITVYDSLYSDVNPSSRANFLRQIAYMLMPTSKHVTIQWADMQKQVVDTRGTSFRDCIVYVAYVHVLTRARMHA